METTLDATQFNAIVQQIIDGVAHVRLIEKQGEIGNMTLQEISDRLTSTNAHLRTMLEQLEHVGRPESSSHTLGERMSGSVEERNLIASAAGKLTTEEYGALLARQLREVIQEHLEQCDGANCPIQLSSVIELALHLAPKLGRVRQ